MKYFVTRVSGGHYSNSDLLLKLNVETPVTLEQYTYLDKTFGNTYFTFRKAGDKKKVKPNKTSEKDNSKITNKKRSKNNSDFTVEDVK